MYKIYINKKSYTQPPRDFNPGDDTVFSSIHSAILEREDGRREEGYFYIALNPFHSSLPDEPPFLLVFYTPRARVWRLLESGVEFAFLDPQDWEEIASSQ